MRRGHVVCRSLRSARRQRQWAWGTGGGYSCGMSMARAFWEELYRRFDPEEPARAHDWRAERPKSPRQTMLAGLNRPFGEPKRYLLIGTVGTGKTTELLAVAEEQSREHMVVFLDVRRHFAESVRDPAALHHVQPWEVLLLVGIAVYRAAAESFGHAWANEHLEQIRQAIAAFSAGAPARGGDAAVDLGKLAGALAIFAGGPVGGLAGHGLKLLGTAAKEVRWSFPLGRRTERLSDQDAQVLDLLNAVNLLIGTVQQRYRPLLMVVDGLDIIEKQETTRDLFVESTLLSSLACRTIVSGPILLRRRGMAAQLRRFEPKVLANAPVLDHADPREPGPGIDFMLDIYRRRVADLEGAGIPDVLLRKLAYYSGGRGRDFVRLVRMTAERAWDRDMSVADEAMVGDSIDERRRILELGLDKAKIALLRDVARDPEHRLPDEEHIGTLLDQFCLLPFPNRSEWYFPHPLLTIELVRLPVG